MSKSVNRLGVMSNMILPPPVVKLPYESELPNPAITEPVTDDMLSTTSSALPSPSTYMQGSSDNPETAGERLDYSVKKLLTREHVFKEVLHDTFDRLNYHRDEAVQNFKGAVKNAVLDHNYTNAIGLVGKGIGEGLQGMYDTATFWKDKIGKEDEHKVSDATIKDIQQLHEEYPIATVFDNKLVGVKSNIDTKLGILRAKREELSKLNFSQGGNIVSDKLESTIWGVGRTIGGMLGVLDPATKRLQNDLASYDSEIQKLQGVKDYVDSNHKDGDGKFVNLPFDGTTAAGVLKDAPRKFLNTVGLDLVNAVGQNLTQDRSWNMLGWTSDKASKESHDPFGNYSQEEIQATLYDGLKRLNQEQDNVKLANGDTTNVKASLNTWGYAVARATTSAASVLGLIVPFSSMSKATALVTKLNPINKAILKSETAIQEMANAQVNLLNTEAHTTTILQHYTNGTTATELTDHLITNGLITEKQTRAAIKAIETNNSTRLQSLIGKTQIDVIKDTGKLENISVFKEGNGITNTDELVDNLKIVNSNPTAYALNKFRKQAAQFGKQVEAGSIKESSINDIMTNQWQQLAHQTMLPTKIIMSAIDNYIGALLATQNKDTAENMAIITGVGMFGGQIAAEISERMGSNIKLLQNSKALTKSQFELYSAKATAIQQIAQSVGNTFIGGGVQTIGELGSGQHADYTHNENFGDFAKMFFTAFVPNLVLAHSHVKEVTDWQNSLTDLQKTVKAETWQSKSIDKTRIEKEQAKQKAETKDMSALLGVKDAVDFKDQTLNVFNPNKESELTPPVDVDGITTARPSTEHIEAVATDIMVKKNTPNVEPLMAELDVSKQQEEQHAETILQATAEKGNGITGGVEHTNSELPVELPSHNDAYTIKNFLETVGEYQQETDNKKLITTKFDYNTPIPLNEFLKTLDLKDIAEYDSKETSNPMQTTLKGIKSLLSNSGDTEAARLDKLSKTTVVFSPDINPNNNHATYKDNVITFYNNPILKVEGAKATDQIKAIHKVINEELLHRNIENKLEFDPAYKTWLTDMYQKVVDFANSDPNLSKRYTTQDMETLKYGLQNVSEFGANVANAERTITQLIKEAYVSKGVTRQDVGLSAWENLKIDMQTKLGSAVSDQSFMDELRNKIITPPSKITSYNKVEPLVIERPIVQGTQPLTETQSNDTPFTQVKLSDIDVELNSKSAVERDKVYEQADLWNADNEVAAKTQQGIDNELGSNPSHLGYVGAETSKLTHDLRNEAHNAIDDYNKEVPFFQTEFAHWLHAYKDTHNNEVPDYPAITEMVKQAQSRMNEIKDYFVPEDVNVEEALAKVAETDKVRNLKSAIKDVDDSWSEALEYQSTYKANVDLHVDNMITPEEFATKLATARLKKAGLAEVKTSAYTDIDRQKIKEIQAEAFVQGLKFGNTVAYPKFEINFNDKTKKVNLGYQKDSKGRQTFDFQSNFNSVLNAQKFINSNIGKVVKTFPNLQKDLAIIKDYLPRVSKDGKVSTENLVSVVNGTLNDIPYEHQASIPSQLISKGLLQFPKESGSLMMKVEAFNKTLSPRQAGETDKALMQRQAEHKVKLDNMLNQKLDFIKAIHNVLLLNSLGSASNNMDIEFLPDVRYILANVDPQAILRSKRSDVVNNSSIPNWLPSDLKVNPEAVKHIQKQILRSVPKNYMQKLESLTKQGQDAHIDHLLLDAMTGYWALAIDPGNANVMAKKVFVNGKLDEGKTVMKYGNLIFNDNTLTINHLDQLKTINPELTLQNIDVNLYPDVVIDKENGTASIKHLEINQLLPYLAKAVETHPDLELLVNSITRKLNKESGNADGGIITFGKKPFMDKIFKATLQADDNAQLFKTKGFDNGIVFKNAIHKYQPETLGIMKDWGEKIADNHLYFHDGTALKNSNSMFNFHTQEKLFDIGGKEELLRIFTDKAGTVIKVTDFSNKANPEYKDLVLQDMANQFINGNIDDSYTKRMEVIGQNGLSFMSADKPTKHNGGSSALMDLVNLHPDLAINIGVFPEDNLHISDNQPQMSLEKAFADLRTNKIADTRKQLQDLYSSIHTITKLLDPAYEEGMFNPTIKQSDYNNLYDTVVKEIHKTIEDNPGQKLHYAHENADLLQLFPERVTNEIGRTQDIDKKDLLHLITAMKNTILHDTQTQEDGLIVKAVNRVVREHKGMNTKNGSNSFLLSPLISSPTYHLDLGIEHELAKTIERINSNPDPVDKEQLIKDAVMLSQQKKAMIYEAFIDPSIDHIKGNGVIVGRDAFEKNKLEIGSSYIVKRTPSHDLESLSVVSIIGIADSPNAIMGNDRIFAKMMGADNDKDAIALLLPDNQVFTPEIYDTFKRHIGQITEQVAIDNNMTNPLQPKQGYGELLDKEFRTNNPLRYQEDDNNMPNGAFTRAINQTSEAGLPVSTHNKMAEVIWSMLAKSKEMPKGEFFTTKEGSKAFKLPKQFNNDQGSLYFVLPASNSESNKIIRSMKAKGFQQGFDNSTHSNSTILGQTLAPYIFDSKGNVANLTAKDLTVRINKFYDLENVFNKKQGFKSITPVKDIEGLTSDNLSTDVFTARALAAQKTKGTIGNSDVKTNEQQTPDLMYDGNPAKISKALDLTLNYNNSNVIETNKQLINGLSLADQVVYDQIQKAGQSKKGFDNPYGIARTAYQLNKGINKYNLKVLIMPNDNIIPERELLNGKYSNTSTSDVMLHQALKDISKNVYEDNGYTTPEHFSGVLNNREVSVKIDKGGSFIKYLDNDKLPASYVSTDKLLEGNFKFTNRPELIKFYQDATRNPLTSKGSPSLFGVQTSLPANVMPSIDMFKFVKHEISNYGFDKDAATRLMPIIRTTIGYPEGSVIDSYKMHPNDNLPHPYLTENRPVININPANKDQSYAVFNSIITSLKGQPDVMRDMWDKAYTPNQELGNNTANSSELSSGVGAGGSMFNLSKTRAGYRDITNEAKDKFRYLATQHPDNEWYSKLADTPVHQWNKPMWSEALPIIAEDAEVAIRNLYYKMNNSSLLQATARTIFGKGGVDIKGITKTDNVDAFAKSVFHAVMDNQDITAQMEESVGANSLATEHTAVMRLVGVAKAIHNFQYTNTYTNGDNLGLRWWKTLNPHQQLISNSDNKRLVNANDVMYTIPTYSMLNGVQTVNDHVPVHYSSLIDPTLRISTPLVETTQQHVESLHKIQAAKHVKDMISVLYKDAHIGTDAKIAEAFFDPTFNELVANTKLTYNLGATGATTIAGIVNGVFVSDFAKPIDAKLTNGNPYFSEALRLHAHNEVASSMVKQIDHILADVKVEGIENSKAKKILADLHTNMQDIYKMSTKEQITVNGMFAMKQAVSDFVDNSNPDNTIKLADALRGEPTIYDKSSIIETIEQMVRANRFIHEVINKHLSSLEYGTKLHNNTFEEPLRDEQEELPNRLHFERLLNYPLGKDRGTLHKLYYNHIVTGKAFSAENIAESVRNGLTMAVGEVSGLAMKEFGKYGDNAYSTGLTESMLSEMSGKEFETNVKYNLDNWQQGKIGLTPGMQIRLSYKDIQDGKETTRRMRYVGQHGINMIFHNGERNDDAIRVIRPQDITNAYGVAPLSSSGKSLEKRIWQAYTNNAPEILGAVKVRLKGQSRLLNANPIDNVTNPLHDDLYSAEHYELGSLSIPRFSIANAINNIVASAAYSPIGSGVFSAVGTAGIGLALGLGFFPAVAGGILHGTAKALMRRAKLQILDTSTYGVAGNTLNYDFFTPEESNIAKNLNPFSSLATKGVKNDSNLARVSQMAALMEQNDNASLSELADQQKTGIGLFFSRAYSAKSRAIWNENQDVKKLIKEVDETLGKVGISQVDVVAKLLAHHDNLEVNSEGRYVHINGKPYSEVKAATFAFSDLISNTLYLTGKMAEWEQVSLQKAYSKQGVLYEHMAEAALTHGGVKLDNSNDIAFHNFLMYNTQQAIGNYDKSMRQATPFNNYMSKFGRYGRNLLADNYNLYHDRADFFEAVSQDFAHYEALSKLKGGENTPEINEAKMRMNLLKHVGLIGQDSQNAMLNPNVQKKGNIIGGIGVGGFTYLTTAVAPKSLAFILGWMFGGNDNKDDLETAQQSILSTTAKSVKQELYGGGQAVGLNHLFSTVTSSFPRAIYVGNVLAGATSYLALRTAVDTHQNIKFSEYKNTTDLYKHTLDSTPFGYGAKSMFAFVNSLLYLCVENEMQNHFKHTNSAWAKQTKGNAKWDIYDYTTIQTMDAFNNAVKSAFPVLGLITDPMTADMKLPDYKKPNYKQKKGQ